MTFLYNFLKNYFIGLQCISDIISIKLFYGLVFIQTVKSVDVNEYINWNNFKEIWRLEKVAHGETLKHSCL